MSSNWRKRPIGSFELRRYDGPLAAIEFAILLPPLMLRDPGTEAMGPSVAR